MHKLTNKQNEQNRCRKHKAMLGPAGRTLHTRPAGNEKDLRMACHTPPLKKAKKQGDNAITQPQSHPI